MNGGRCSFYGVIRPRDHDTFTTRNVTFHPFTSAITTLLAASMYYAAHSPRTTFGRPFPRRGYIGLQDRDSNHQGHTRPAIRTKPWLMDFYIELQVWAHAREGKMNEPEPYGVVCPVKR